MRNLLIKKNMKNLIFIFNLFFILPAFCTQNISQRVTDLLPVNPLIFDIGANIGEKTEQYLSLNPKAIVCIEPIPECINLLKTRFKNDHNVFIISACASYYIGEINFFLNDVCPGISTADVDWKSGRFKHSKWTNSIMVPTITIDELVLQYGMPDFCKIDVEGYELHVLEGMKTPIPYLSFEFTSEFLDKKTKPCLEYLESLGYKSFNVAISESDSFNATKNWLDKETLYTYLKNHPDPLLWGDIYARFYD